MVSLPSDNIKRLRMIKGITQKQLASILGVSSKTVSKWETGLGQPEINQIAPLAQVFGVSIDELFHGPKLLDVTHKTSTRESRSIQIELERINTLYRITPEFLLQTAGADESDLKDLIDGRIPVGKEKQDKRKMLVKLIIVFNDLIPRYVENTNLVVSTLFTKLSQESEVPVETIERYANLAPGTITAFLSGSYPLTQKAICDLITTLFMLDVSINQEEAFPMDE